MRLNIIKSGLFIPILFFLLMFEVNGTDISINGRKNYSELKNIYDKWNNGLFGSRKYYRNRLFRLLTDMTGADIQTGKDYNVLIPDVFEKKYYSSDLYDQKWLNIRGPVDVSSKKEFELKGSNYIKELERNKNLFFLSGRVVDFRIVETEYSRSVTLYLDSVKIEESVK